ncbi:MAG: glycosyltransferase family 8 protein [Thermosynechococcaceae cyanobacterium MS004]|nr:glycosyltransferase family 8 protein [Thermosynechococcaceae cyanobacterium MS004]
MSQPSSLLDPIVLVCAADDRYALPLAVTVVSVAMNHRGDRPLQLFVIDGGIQAENRRRLERTMQRHRVALQWITPDATQVEHLMISGHITTACYYRLLIPDLLPKHIEKALYLDSDLIVLGDIEDLWNEHLGNQALLAVADLNAHYVSSPMGLLNYKALGIPSNRKYFNSGVLCLNLALWRRERLAQKVVSYIEQNREFVRWHDQDGLNAILFDRWGELDPQWNRASVLHRCQSWQDSPYSEALFKRLLKHPAIIHFTESGKPWTPGFQHPEKHYFFEYLDRTAWSGWQIRFDLWLQRVQTKVEKLRRSPSISGELA